jgi:hypothetical protein
LIPIVAAAEVAMNPVAMIPDDQGLWILAKSGPDWAMRRGKAL